MAAAKMLATIDGASGVINIPPSASVPMINTSTMLDTNTSRLGREDQIRLRSRTT